MLIVTDDPIPISAISGIEPVTLEAIKSDMQMPDSKYARRKDKELEIEWVEVRFNGTPVYVSQEGLAIVGLKQDEVQNSVFIGKANDVDVEVDLVQKQPDSKFQEFVINIKRSNSKDDKRVTNAQGIVFDQDLTITHYQRKSFLSRRSGAITTNYTTEDDYGGVSWSNAEGTLERAKNIVQRMRESLGKNPQIKMEVHDGSTNIFWNNIKIINGVFEGENSILNLSRGFIQNDGSYRFYTPEGEMVTFGANGELEIVRKD